MTEPHPPVPVIIHVVGDPAPKGSNRAMLIGGRASFVPGGSKPNQAKLGSWKTAVTDAWESRRQRPDQGPLATFTAGPLAVGLIFRFPLRKGDLDKYGAPRHQAPLAVTVKPDLDKLVRSTFDALTSAGAWTDDAQVALCFASKLYTPPGCPTGATIIIGAIDPYELGSTPAVWKRWDTHVDLAGDLMLRARADATITRDKMSAIARKMRQGAK